MTEEEILRNCYIFKKRAEVKITPEEKVEKEKKFLTDLDNVLKYVKEMKDKEPGWHYDNFKEFDDLFITMQDLGITDPDVQKKMKTLTKEVEAAQYLLDHPIRTPEEQKFYEKLCGINSYIYEQKQKDPNYIFPNVEEAKKLLDEFEALKTKDPYILAIMGTIMKDIKKTIEKTKGKEETDEFQERLDKLNIKISDDDELEDKLGKDALNPESSKRIKGKRKATPEELASLKEQKKRNKTALITAGYIAGAIGLFLTAGPITQLAGAGILIATAIAHYKKNKQERDGTTTKKVGLFKRLGNWLDDFRAKTFHKDGTSVGEKMMDWHLDGQLKPGEKITYVPKPTSDGMAENFERLRAEAEAKRAAKSINIIEDEEELPAPEIDEDSVGERGMSR